MMGEPLEAPDYEDVIQAFSAWVDGAKSYEVIDPDTNLLRPFIVADDLLNHFKQDNSRKLKKIIVVHFPAGADSLFADDVVPNNVAVFSILLSISKGRWMKQFRHHNHLSDTALPFDPSSPPPNWPQKADFLLDFCEAQWPFCAPVLSAPFVGKRFHKDMVLPIVWKETLNTEGSSASLWLIKIHPSYNKLISEADKVKLGALADTFVLKTYFTNEAESYYNTEVAAFRHLGINPSIIKFHGSFARGDNYNVLLEYADKGTLADYFKNEMPPSDGDEIIRFWEAMFKLLDALRRIHEVGADDTDGPRVFQGRHQDVKPENVLIISNGSENRGDWVFKLADLGISKFKGKGPARQDSADKNARGTRTYGAPESYRPDGTYVHDTLREGQNSDIWSLGCIYSEAARWLKDGYQGIEAYRQDRLKETSQLQGFRDGDCFHNGEKMLTSVRQCHRKCVQSLRSEDFITRPVVEVLIADMLGLAEARSTAFKLYHKSKQLVIDAREDLERHQAPRAEAEPSNLSRMHSKTKNRSVTVPVHDSRPPAPPNLPPGFFRGTNLHVVPPNTDAFNQHVSPMARPLNYSPPTIFETSNTTAEPEMIESPQHPPQPPLTPPNTRISPSQDLYGTSSTIRDEPKVHSGSSNGTQGRLSKTAMASPQYGYDTSSVGSPGLEAKPSSSRSHVTTLGAGPGSSGSQNNQPFPTVGPDTRNEVPSPHGSPSTVPAASIPYQHPSTTAHESTTSPQRSPTSRDSRHNPTESIARPKPVVIQEHPLAPAHPPLPNLSLTDGLEWRRDRKGNRPKTPLKDSQYLDRLKDRDHVFLIDDSRSMSPHWKNVLKVFETLSYIVKGQDPDGFDLWFTGPGKPLKQCSKTTDAVQAAKLRKLSGTTDITNKLSQIFDDYIEALEKPKTNFFGRPAKPVKPLSLYVFTDGVWEKDCNPRDLVESFVRQLVALNKVKGKVGIQFISFGQDPVGLARMELLDSGLNVKLDIVDTEPWNGNVWKMLLGAINESFDRIDEHNDREHNGASSSSNRMSMMANNKDEY